MATAIDAHLGLWRDHSRQYLNQWQILATDFWSRWMTAFVTVCLTLISPYVFRISKSFLVWFFGLLSWLATVWSDARAERLSASRNPPGSDTPLLREHRQNTGTEPADVSQHRSSDQNGGIGPSTQSHGAYVERRRPLNILEGSENSRGTVRKFAEGLLHSGAEQVESPSIIMVVITTVLFGLFVAQAIAGVFSAKIASDRTGLSSSKQCGIWQFDDNAGVEAADRDDLNNYQKEARAGQYASNCYHSPDSTSTLSCKIFYNQSIAYTTKISQLCPFASSELCLDGLYSAVTFDTSFVDASTIGINSPLNYKFRRTTTCSPLNMSEPYVKGPKEGANDTTYRYYYGPKDNVDYSYTFRTSGHPFEWLVPVYSVNTYFSSLYPKSDYWQPLPGLRPQMNSTLTVIFVSSMHIYHTKPSFDPIFNATTPRYLDGIRDPYYYNADPRARALGCVDTTELCSPDGKTCWSMTAPVPPNVPSSSAYWLMKWSLENSNIYDSIKRRLGTALQAQQSINQFVSNPLPPDQWCIEASQLFATSLARIQYDAWGIATGEDRERPGYVEVTPDEASGRLCNLYKFKTAEYTNINLAAFIGFPLLAASIFFLSWNAETVGLAPTTRRDETTSTQPLVIDVLVKFFLNVTTASIIGIYFCMTFLFRKLKEGIHEIRRRAT